MENLGFKLADIKISQNFAEQLLVKKELNTIPIRKPGKQEFVRTHPDPDYRIQLSLIEIKGESEYYLVLPSVRDHLISEITAQYLFLTMNRDGVLSLWPVKIPTDTDRKNRWPQSALEAATSAATKWVRVKANMSLGAYEHYSAAGELTDPDWPERSFEELLNIAFRDRIIGDLEHPIVKRLRGLQ
jgi:hypothetical protein